MEQATARNFAASFDLEHGVEAEIELQGGNSLWIAAGRGIESADVWMKDVSGLGLDLRVEVRRNSSGIEVRIDRGKSGEPWWSAESPPRLFIAVDQAANTAVASASIGETSEGTISGKFAL